MLRKINFALTAIARLLTSSQVGSKTLRKRKRSDSSADSDSGPDPDSETESDDDDYNSEGDNSNAGPTLPYSPWTPQQQPAPSASVGSSRDPLAGQFIRVGEYEGVITNVQWKDKVPMKPLEHTLRELRAGTAAKDALAPRTAPTACRLKTYVSDLAKVGKKHEPCE